jgi:hypothetical protein
MDMYSAALFGGPQRKRSIFGAQRPSPMLLLKDGWMFRFSCSTVLLMFVVLTACSDSSSKVSASSDAGFDLSEGVDALGLPDTNGSVGTCEESGGRCQSPDLPCDSGTVFAGYELCGDQPNNSCCLPTEPAPGVVGAFSTSGSGYVESTVLHVEAFASGGAFITMSHRGELVIPMVDGQFSSTPAADVDEVLGLWVDPQGAVQNVVRLALGRADVQVFPLRNDVAVAVRSAPDATVLPDGGAYKDGAWRSLLLVVDAAGGVTLRAVLTAADGAPQFSAISESPANELFIAAQQTGVGQTLEVIGGVTTLIPELAVQPSEWGVRAWFVRVRGASNDLRFLGGNGTVHINAMAPTNDGGLWICGDVGGYGSDMIEAPRVWTRDGLFRVGLSARDESVIFKGDALESTLQIQPNPERGVSTRLSFDGGSGAPAALAGGGVAGGTLLANGALLVVNIGFEEIVMGTASPNPTICPASDTPHLCVAVVGPAPIEGLVIQQ